MSANNKKTAVIIVSIFFGFVVSYTKYFDDTRKQRTSAGNCEP